MTGLQTYVTSALHSNHSHIFLCSAAGTMSVYSDITSVGGCEEEQGPLLFAELSRARLLWAAWEEDSMCELLDDPP